MLQQAPDHFVEGELQGHVIISVPASITQQAAQDFRQKLMEQFQRPVLIVTHNVQFMRAQKLKPAEAAKVVKRIEEVVYGGTESSKTPEADVGASGEVDGDGNRSGVRVDGGSGVEPVTGAADPG